MKLVLAALPMSLILLAACQRAPAPQPAVDSGLAATVDATRDAAAQVNAIADRYYDHVLSTTPEAAYFSGVEPERHDGMKDNSLEGVARRNAAVDAMLQDLAAIDADTLQGDAAWITHAYLAQELASGVALRVCRNELWNVNQMGGWHSDYVQIAGLQPVGTPELRRQSLDRWSQFAGFIQREIGNLGTGLEQG
jgi:uncharacterized protein (DUF885 family)